MKDVFMSDFLQSFHEVQFGGVVDADLEHCLQNQTKIERIENLQNAKNIRLSSNIATDFQVWFQHYVTVLNTLLDECTLSRVVQDLTNPENEIELHAGKIELTSDAAHQDLGLARLTW